MSVPSAAQGQRRRVPASERRAEIVAIAVEEFAEAGFHGTPVDRIARRAGVAQPYVFSLFGNKRDLFLAAVRACFAHIADLFRRAAEDFAAGRAPADCEDALMAMGRAYKEMLASDRSYLMLQLQSYAACDDEAIRATVRRGYAQLVELAGELSGAGAERVDDFFRHGMALNVAAAMEVEEISSDCPWVRAELEAIRAA